MSYHSNFYLGKVRSSLLPSEMADITYHSLVRCIEVFKHQDLDENPTPWFGWDFPISWDLSYTEQFENNCAQKYNEVYLPGINGLDLLIAKYPIHSNSDAVAFTNTSNTELEYQKYLIVFETPSGKTLTKKVYTNRYDFYRIRFIFRHLTVFILSSLAVLNIIGLPYESRSLMVKLQPISGIVLLPRDMDIATFSICPPMMAENSWNSTPCITPIFS